MMIHLFFYNNNILSIIFYHKCEYNFEYYIQHYICLKKSLFFNKMSTNYNLKGT